MEPTYDIKDDVPHAAGTTSSVALVRRPLEQVRELKTYLEDLDAIANALCKSTILPRDMQTPANLKLVLLQGLAMGFDPIQAIRASYIISSKDQPPRVGYYVEALVALVRSSAVCRFFRVEVATVEKCRVVCARKDEDEAVVHVFEMTIEQARAANLDKKWERDQDNRMVAKVKYTWQTATADMLRNRTCGRAVKTVFQDVVFGMATPDELDDIANAEQLEASASREYSAVPLRSDPVVVVVRDKATPPADVVDAELVDEPAAAEGSGDPAWDEVLALFARTAGVDTAGWLPSELLELWSSRLGACASKAQLALIVPWMGHVGARVSESKSCSEVFAAMRKMFNERDAEIRKHERQLRASEAGGK